MQSATVWTSVTLKCRFVHLSNVRRISPPSESDRGRISPNVCKSQNKRRLPKETQDCHQAHHRMPRDATCKVLEERNHQESALTDRKAAYNLLNIINTLLAASSVGVFTNFEGCFRSVLEALAGFLKGLVACLKGVCKGAC